MYSLEKPRVYALLDASKLLKLGSFELGVPEYKDKFTSKEFLHQTESKT